MTPQELQQRRTEQNLLAAAAGEHEEWTGMYKRMAEKAPEACPVCDHPQAYFQLEQNNF